MACCLTAPSLHLSQCWLLISEVRSHSYESSFITIAQGTIICNEFENCTLIIPATSPRGQWVKHPTIFIPNVVNFVVKTGVHRSWSGCRGRTHQIIHVLQELWPKHSISVLLCGDCTMFVCFQYSNVCKVSLSYHCFAVHFAQASWCFCHLHIESFSINIRSFYNFN